MRKHCKNCKKIALELSETGTNQYSHKKDCTEKYQIDRANTVRTSWRMEKLSKR